MGFEVLFADTASRSLGEDHPIMLYQQSLAGKLWRYTFEVVKHILLGFAPLFGAYPYMFAKLCDSRPKVCQAALAQCKHDLAGWRRCAGSNNPWWKRICERSSFNWTVTQEMFELLEFTGWALTGEVRSAVDRLICHFGQTVVAEVAFRDINEAERENKCKKISGLTVWRKPVVRGTLSKTFAFKEVDASSTRFDSKLVKDQLPSSLLQPRYKQASMDFKDLPGKQPPTWTHLSPQTLPVLASDSRLMAEAADKESVVGDASMSWKAILCQDALHANASRSHAATTGPCVTQHVCKTIFFDAGVVFGFPAAAIMLIFFLGGGTGFLGLVVVCIRMLSCMMGVLHLFAAACSVMGYWHLP
jgi:hypothetical protein